MNFKGELPDICRMEAVYNVWSGLLVAGLILNPISLLAQTDPDVVRISSAQGLDGDNFGASAVLHTATAVVGAPLSDEFGANAGAAHIFNLDPQSGAWIQSATVVGDVVADFAFFGRAVDLDKGLLIAGSPESPTIDDWPQDPGTNKGTVYVFERAGSKGAMWTQTGMLRASDGEFADEFGRALAVAGNTIVVAAQGHYAGSIRNGAAYVFEFNTELSEWEETQKLLPLQLTDLALFGSAVDMQTDLVAIGAPGAFFSPDNPGAVHVFTQSAPPFSAWGQSAQLVGSESQPGDRFGNAIAVEGNLLAASSIEQGGTVYLFDRDSLDGSWQQIARLQPDPPVPAAGFGQSLAIDAGVLIVGAPFDGPDGSGAAYVFSRGGANGNTWHQIAHIAIAGASGARIGFSVSAHEGYLLLGAPLAIESSAAPGAAFITGTPRDSDSDGIADGDDNCAAIANGPALTDMGGYSQRDTDADDFGNVCDADFNNDCVVDFEDVALMRDAFFVPGDIDQDLNGDGSVNFVDLAAIKAALFSAPGPSGLTSVCD